MELTFYGILKKHMQLLQKEFFVLVISNSQTWYSIKCTRFVDFLKKIKLAVDAGFIGKVVFFSFRIFEERHL